MPNGNVMAEGNALLSALLSEAGMSNQGLASRINQAGQAAGYERPLRYDHRSVGRWLRRGERPRDPTPDLICRILSERLRRALTLDDVGLGRDGGAGNDLPLGRFIDRATTLWRADATSQPSREPEFLTGTRAIASVWEWENLPEDHDISRRGTLAVGATDVQLLMDARHHYQEMYRNSGGLAALPRLTHFLHKAVAPALAGGYSDETGRQLHHAAGGLVALAGIFAYDSDIHGRAQEYFHQAIRLAKSSGNKRFGAYTVALMVNQSLARGDFRQAVALAESALRSVEKDLTPAQIADLRVMQAKAYAQMGDSVASYAAMAAAESAAARIVRANEPEETNYVQPGLVEAQLAEALISIGDFEAAERYAQQSLGGEAHPRGRVNRLVSTATLALRSGDAEKAAHLAIETVALSRGMESRRLNDRFAKLRAALNGCSSKVTSDAIEAIDRTLQLAQWDTRSPEEW
jgi:tetratricopeptide (TPR) repeat protein